MATGGGRDEDNLHEEWFDFNCTTCSKKMINRQALLYCVVCDKYLCSKCAQIEDVCCEDGHTLVDVEDADHGTIDILTERCDKHNDKVIELFCEVHDDVVCSVCAKLEHGKCPDLQRITEDIEIENKDPKKEETPIQLKSALQNVETVIAALDQHAEDLSDGEQKFLEDIEILTKDILAKIEQIKSNAKKEVTTKHQKLASAVTDKRQTCMMMKKAICNNLNKMNASRRRKANLFVLMKRGQVLTNNVETICRKAQVLMKESNLVFGLDRRIVDCLNDFSTLVVEENHPKRTLETYKTISKSSFNLSVPGDRNKVSDIEGCCLLHDETVLLADRKNKRLKSFNTSTRKFKDYYELDEYVMGITLISPQEVAVCSLLRSVQIFSLSKKLGLKQTIRTNHCCSRLVQSRGELFVADGNTVYVHDIDGQLLRTICMDNSGQKMFKNIQGIDVDSTGETVYVSDLGNGLVCLDGKGRKRFQRSPEELGVSKLYGVCTDHLGNAFVCGLGSNNVVQVSSDGHVLGEILANTDGIEKPQCLCFDPETYTLYVGGETSKLLKFNLQ